MSEDITSQNLAAEEYRQATRLGEWRRLWARLSGRDDSLLPYELVRKSVGFRGQQYGGRQAVPLDKIVGSLNRSADFDRAFFPRQRHSRGKWISVDAAMLAGVSLPPVSLYKVGDAYFVVDGHHRVSVARQKNQAFIDAEVVEVQSRVPVTDKLSLDDLDVYAAYLQFLEQTKLDQLRPEQNVRLTMPGDYARLIEHIRTHKYFMEVNASREYSWDEAVTDWYDRVYMPVVETIRQGKLLREFPGLTESDLYLSVIEHGYYMSLELGQEVSPHDVARDFADRYGRTWRQVIRRVIRRLSSVLVPQQIASGPRAGTWREGRVEARGAEHLFSDILVTLTGADTGWMALEQAAEFARREQGVLRGLHVRTSDDAEAVAQAERISRDFAARTQALAVKATFKQVRADDVAQAIIERARWADMVVINQRRVEGRWAERPLGTIFQTVANNTSCPILAVPGAPLAAVRRVLVAYDGSPKSREALFIFKHLVTCWRLDGIILSVASGDTHSQMLSLAKAYVEEGEGVQVGVRYVSGVAHQAIIREASEENIDLLLMGGYGYQPLLKAVLGSTVDQVLRMAWFPVLICR